MYVIWNIPSNIDEVDNDDDDDDAGMLILRWKLQNVGQNEECGASDVLFTCPNV